LFAPHDRWPAQSSKQIASSFSSWGPPSNGIRTRALLLVNLDRILGLSGQPGYGYRLTARDTDAQRLNSHFFASQIGICRSSRYVLPVDLAILSARLRPARRRYQYRKPDG
jgi:hypothetical protein